MKKNIIYIIIAQIIFLFSTCNTGDDLYYDPSNPAEASPQTMLTSLEVNTFMNYEGELARVTSIFTQHMAGTSGQYTDMQNYDIAESAFSNSWDGLYTGTMYNAKLLIEKYAIDRPYYSGMAKILMAMNLGITTDIWGDVPYSDAFQAESGNFTAKYDTQEDVINTIQTLLSEGIDELNKEKDDNIELPDEDDIVFEGNKYSWIRAAWILKARYANRLSLKNSNESATKMIEYITNALAVVPPTESDEVVTFKTEMEAVHDNTAQNQWAVFDNSRGLFRANKYFMDILKTRTDPRLEYYFSLYVEKDKDGNIIVSEYRGSDITQSQISADASRINISNTGYFRANRNYPLVTEAEMYFLLAEAKQRLGQDASTDLNDAIKSSISYVSEGRDDGTSMATYTAATATLENIITEKWIALFGQVETYNDYRRTGIPNLTPRPESAGAIRAYIPKRFPIVEEERLYNPNAPLLGLDTPVWWATK